MGRVISYGEKTGYNDGDYLLLDNGSGGTKRIRADRVGVQLDSSLTQPGMAAPADVVGDIVDGATGPNKNLIYHYPWTSLGGSAIYNDTNIVVTATSASTYRGVEFTIPCDNNNFITVSFQSKTSSTSGDYAASIQYGFVDQNDNITWKGYISASPTTINIGVVQKLKIRLYVNTIAVPVGATATYTKLQVEYGDSATSFSSLKYDGVNSKLSRTVEKLKTDIPDIVDQSIAGVGVNKFNPDATETGFIKGNTGAINPSSDYFTSDFIDISEFTQGYAFSPKARKILFYDENKNAITSSYRTDETPASVIPIDNSYKYVRFSWFYTSSNVIVCDSSALLPYEPYEIRAKDGINFVNSETLTAIEKQFGGNSKEKAIREYLYGKTIAVFGDSIMYGAGSDSKGAVDIFAEKYGMVVNKYCVSGSTMGIRTDDPTYTVDEVHHIAKQVRSAITANIAPDIIVFNGGTNDIGGNIPIGEMTQVYTAPSSENVFANGFETVAYLLVNNFVGIPIIYMRAHNMSSRSYEGQINYGELGNKIAQKWGIRIVDMYKRMNTQLEAYRTLYLADYTHPNTAGYNKYYIPALEEFVFCELA